MPNARTALVVVLAATFALLYWLWTALPPDVANHFDLEGRADSASSRGALLITFAVVAALDALFFLAIPTLIRRLPSHVVSMPNREHWLAPERREATLEELGSRLTWLGVLFGLFFFALIWETGRANLEPASDGVPVLGPVFWSALAGILLAVAFWTRSLYRRFGSVPTRNA